MAERNERTGTKNVSELDSSLVVEHMGNWMKEDSGSKVKNLDSNIIFNSYAKLPLDADGLDSNIKFRQHIEEMSKDSTQSDASESGSEESLPKLDTEVTPFSLIWSFGINVSVPFINLTKKKETVVFYSASHNGILYDYHSKEMQILRGHQNSITSVAIDNSGKYLVTADSGPENSIIVWNLHSNLPIRTIFDANPGSGTKILQISCGGKYIISITDEDQASLKFWLWTQENDTPDDTYVQKKSFGRAVAIAFNPNVEEHFMIAFGRICVFMQWNSKQKKLSEPHVPEIRKRKSFLSITDCTYVCECNECMASTSDGSVIIFGNALNVIPYETESTSNEKIFVKIVKISANKITCLKYVDGFLVTTDDRGYITFFDKRLKILYWCTNFKLPAINCISFNMEPRNYKFEDPFNLEDGHFSIPSPRQILHTNDFIDLSNEYEILYKNLVPSDATINRPPFVVRDFMVSTEDGNLIKIDYMTNSSEHLFNITDSDVAAIDVHDEQPYLMIAYKRGRVSLYNYETHSMLATGILPETKLEIEMGENGIFDEGTYAVSYAEITTLKYSYQGFYLAVGRDNGEIWFLDPILLQHQHNEPMRPTKKAIVRMCFSKNSKYFAFFDNKHTVFLCENVNKKWVFSGKIRSHYRSITDIMFTSAEPYELYTIGRDRHVVNYDLENREEDFLSIKSRDRTDQSSICNSMIEYSLPHCDKQYFLLADDQYKLKILDPETKLYRHIFLGPSAGCFSESPINQMEIVVQKCDEYLLFCNDRHIGMLILPPDGNPYKYTGTIAHPEKILNFRVDKDGLYMFTCGENDLCVLMWKIHLQAVENLCQSGGQELTPFYSLIEGGSQGWLFSEMQNLFYYMQILQQGVNSILPRNVTDRIALSELPDLMRACGFYPTEYEIENMLNDIRNQNVDNGSIDPEEIKFIDFVMLYINHRPAHGIFINKLSDAFEDLTRYTEYGAAKEVSAEEFTNIICEQGETFSREAAYKCLSILMHCSPAENGKDEKLDDASGSSFGFLPQEIDFDTFSTDMLGIDLDRDQDIDESLKKMESGFFRL